MKGKKFFILKQMVQLSEAEIRKYIRTSDKKVISVLCECLHNVIRGNVKVRIDNLQQYENIFRIVLRKRTSLDKKRAILLTKTGFELVWLIIRFYFAHLS